MTANSPGSFPYQNFKIIAEFGIASSGIRPAIIPGSASLTQTFGLSSALLRNELAFALRQLVRKFIRFAWTSRDDSHWRNE